MYYKVVPKHYLDI